MASANELAVQRTEVIDGIPVHAWSQLDLRSVVDGCGFRGNEHHIVVLDQATVYEAHGPQPVTDVSRDTFVGFVAVLRATRSASMSWPFVGQGIRDAGPSPFGPDGWLVTGVSREG
jgi:hypothetical protein